MFLYALYIFRLDAVKRSLMQGLAGQLISQTAVDEITEVSEEIRACAERRHQASKF